MSEISNEELLKAYTAEVIAKGKTKAVTKETTQPVVSPVSSEGLEGISVNGRDLGGSRLESGTEAEKETGIKGVRKIAVSTVPRELMGATRANSPISPEKSADSLRHDDKGWYRMVGAKKVYE